jgi:type I restriction enzyme R subunit
LLSGEIQLRSKKELIEKFIEENLPGIAEGKDIPKAFDQYIEAEKQTAFKKICVEEKLEPDELNKVLSNYLFTERKPMPDAIINLLQVKPKLLERKSIIKRITDKISEFVETYISGVSSIVQTENHPDNVRTLDYDVVDEGLQMVAKDDQGVV